MKNILFLLLINILFIGCKKAETIETEPVISAKGGKKPDKTRPTVTITSPLAGTFIAPGEQFTVTADAYDAAGLWKVGFTFNGLYKMMTTGPWAATYTMPTFVTQGMTMWVDVEAVDVNGNSGFNVIYLYVGQPQTNN